jgi:hypothetical protein
MAMATFKCEFPRRQAMLSIRERRPLKPDGTIYGDYAVEYVETARVPVFVWPMPTQDGYFIVEHQDGRCQKVQPHELTFIGIKELFDQYDWSEHA